MPPGWYYADGDQPGTQRYWDGTQWQGGPQFAAGAPRPGFGPPVAQYPEGSQALAALLVSIGGFVLCGLLWPVGWWMGNREVNGIDAGLRDPSNRGLAQAGKYVGMIMTVLMVLFLVGFAVLVVVGASTA